MAENQEPTYAEVNQDVLETLLHTGKGYWILLGVSMTVVVVCFVGPWIYRTFEGLSGRVIRTPIRARTESAGGHG